MPTLVSTTDNTKLAENIRIGLTNAQRQGVVDALAALITDHESWIRSLREHVRTVEDDLRDIGTTDFLPDLIRQHEMDAWMLRSSLDHPGHPAS